MDGEKCTCCTCGYQWVRGFSGHHHCSEYMTKTIERLNAQVAMMCGVLDYIRTFTDDSDISCRCTDAIQSTNPEQESWLATHDQQVRDKALDAAADKCAEVFTASCLPLNIYGVTAQNRYTEAIRAMKGKK